MPAWNTRDVMARRSMEGEESVSEIPSTGFSHSFLERTAESGILEDGRRAAGRRGTAWIIQIMARTARRESDGIHTERNGILRSGDPLAERKSVDALARPCSSKCRLDYLPDLLHDSREHGVQG